MLGLEAGLYSASGCGFGPVLGPRAGAGALWGAKSLDSVLGPGLRAGRVPSMLGLETGTLGARSGPSLGPSLGLETWGLYIGKMGK